MTFSSEVYCASSWDANSKTFTWGSGGWSTAFTFIVVSNLSGDLSEYTKLHFKLEDFSSNIADADKKLTLYFKENKGNTQSMDYVAKVEITPDANGEFEFDLTTFDWKNDKTPSETIDKTNIVDVTIYGGPRTDSNDGSVKITEAYAERPKVTWTDLIENGDMEGEDNSCFAMHEQFGATGCNKAPIVAGVGKNDSRGIKVHTYSNPGYAWDSQFFIRVPKKLPAGTKYKISFDYKATVAGTVGTQAQAAPGDYIHWACIGDVDFTTAWKTFEKEGTITSDMSKNDHLMYSIAFNVGIGNTEADFFFDNVKFEVDADIVAGLEDSDAPSVAGAPSVTVPDAGWTTFIYNKPLSFTGVNAYIAAYENGYVNLTPITAAPAYTPVIIEAAKNTYPLSEAATTDDVSANQLLVSNGTVSGKDNTTIYVLANKTNGIGFYLLSDAVTGKDNNNNDTYNTIPAGKAYLNITTLAPEFIGFSGTTAIETVKAAKANRGEFFNLAGQRVANPSKGLYIVNGQKVILK